MKETRDKQVALWCSLVLQYCQHTKVRASGRVSVGWGAVGAELEGWGCEPDRADRCRPTNAAFCRLQTFVLDVQGDSPLFVNKVINRKCTAGSVQRFRLRQMLTCLATGRAGKLNQEARVAILDELATQGEQLLPALEVHVTPPPQPTRPKELLLRRCGRRASHARVHPH